MRRHNPWFYAGGAGIKLEGHSGLMSSIDPYTIVTAVIPSQSAIS